MFHEKLEKYERAVKKAVNNRVNVNYALDQNAAMAQHVDVIVCDGDGSGFCDCWLDRVLFALCQEHKITETERLNFGGL